MNFFSSSFSVFIPLSFLPPTSPPFLPLFLSFPFHLFLLFFLLLHLFFLFLLFIYILLSILHFLSLFLLFFLLLLLLLLFLLLHLLLLLLFLLFFLLLLLFLLLFLFLLLLLLLSLIFFLFFLLLLLFLFLLRLVFLSMLTFWAFYPWRFPISQQISIEKFCFLIHRRNSSEFFPNSDKKRTRWLQSFIADFETNGFLARCNFIYTLRHSHLQFFCVFINAVAIHLSVFSILMESQLVLHNYSLKVFCVDKITMVQKLISVGHPLKSHQNPISINVRMKN